MKAIAIDAFAGAGGLSLGLIEAGWQVALAFDNDPIAVDTYGRTSEITSAGLMPLCLAARTCSNMQSLSVAS